VTRIRKIFDAYRGEADRAGFICGPEQLAIRRNISVAQSEAEAREASRMAMEVTSTLLAADPRVGRHTPSLLDAPKADSGFSVHADEFIAGTPAQVAEQIIEQKKTRFQPELFEDRYEVALLALVKSKINGGEPVIAKAPERGNVVNLMDALKRSVEQERRPPAPSLGKAATAGASSQPAAKAAKSVATPAKKRKSSAA